MTRTDVIRRALQALGVLNASEPASGEEVNYADDVLTSIIAELAAVHGVTLTFPLTDAQGKNVADILASDLMGYYQVPYGPRSRGIMAVRAIALPDDRPNRADLDEDGTVTDDEQAAYDRAAFY